MPQPKISVLVPVYNVEKYIRKCASSLFSNSLASSCEFIFTNDCSTDSSMSVLNSVISKYPELKKNIKIFHHKKNSGLGKTRNTGFDNASGEYIICVDSDDWVEPDYLECLYNKACESNADVVGCDAFFEYEETNSKKTVQYPLSENSTTALIDLYKGRLGGYLWIKLLKRQFLIDHNIRWQDDVSMWEDVLIDTKILSKNPQNSYISKPLYHYLIRKGSYLHTLYTIEKADNIFRAVDYIKEYLIQNNMQTILNEFRERSYILKYEIISKGNKQTQIKYLSLYPELNSYMNKSNTKAIYRLIFSLYKMNKKLGWIILCLFCYSKILLGKINYKEYKGY